MKNNIGLMIKPASSLCNLRCKYCFYADVSQHREIECAGIMGEQVMCATVDRALQYAEGGAVSFAFQGGEPTMAGLEYFKRFAEYADARNELKSPISYCIQTNATLLDDAFCDFLHKRGFLVGVSLDGDAQTHNANRVSADGKGSYNKVMRGIELLKKHRVEFNILTVATKLTARHANRIYDFFMKNGFTYMQFITCLEPLGAPPFSSPYAMNNEEYLAFNKALFLLYIRDLRAGKQVSIRHYDNLLMMLQGQPPELCGISGKCSGQLVVESAGECYPCDFYCDDEHRMGNILTDSLEDMALSRVMREFTEQSLTLPEQCKSCEVYALCRNGCTRERSDGISMYCEARKEFFAYVIELLSNR